MTGNLALLVKGLSKRFEIGRVRERYPTLRERLGPGLGKKIRDLTRRRRTRRAERDASHIWALKDVSLQLEVGEVLGLIGSNGAGKTTLLRVLSRITPPTSGYALLQGRVGALLEVGTGFHPELTGRENVYLNGAILGMPRREIEAKLEAIVSFAGVERFIDTPVKRYSSGMQVRLAFSVAAHLEPDILIVDEVLAVGDAAFQKKCISSMRERTSGGGTVLIVSHNLAVIRSLCNRAVLLEDGKVTLEGRPEQVISRYLENVRPAEAVYRASGIQGRDETYIEEVSLESKGGSRESEIPCGEEFVLRLAIHIGEDKEIRHPWIGIRIYGEDGELIAYGANREANFDLPTLQGRVEVLCRCREMNLLPGEYYLGVVVADDTHRIYDRVDNAIGFAITEADVFESGVLFYPHHGHVFLRTSWAASGECLS